MIFFPVRKWRNGFFLTLLDVSLLLLLLCKGSLILEGIWTLAPLAKKVKTPPLKSIAVYRRGQEIQISCSGEKLAPFIGNGTKVFFNRRYSLLSVRLPQLILIHIKFDALPITYSVYCVFVELPDKLYNP